MGVPESVRQGLEWVLLLSLAYFSADTAAALLENQLRVAPQALVVSSIVKPNPSAKASGLAVPPGLAALFATTEPAEGLPRTAGKLGSTATNPSGASAVSSASLKLKGTMASDGGGGLAMIDVNGQTQVFGVGEMVVSGLKLVAVTAYSATVEGDGRSQVLEMDVPTDVSAVMIADSGPSAQATPDPDASPNPDGSQASPSPGAAILSQRELRNILDHPEQFAGNGFRMKPVLREGEIVGMRISLRDPNHPLARLGVQDGDIVRSLNGQELNGPEALTSIYRVIRNSPNLRFEVERQGQPQVIDVALSE